MIKNFRNLLALLIAVIVFPSVWVLQGLGMLILPGEVIGMTIAVETMIAQFYFRKASTAEETPRG